MVEVGVRELFEERPDGESVSDAAARSKTTGFASSSASPKRTEEASRETVSAVPALPRMSAVRGPFRVVTAPCGERSPNAGSPAAKAKPSRAMAMAGAIRSASVKWPEPYLSSASARPATVPGTPMASDAGLETIGTVKDPATLNGALSAAGYNGEAIVVLAADG